MSNTETETGKQVNKRPEVVSRRLAEYASSLSFENLPSDVVRQVKRIVLDSLGCCMGGYGSEASRIVQQVIKEFGGSPESTVIGSGLNTSCLNALLANGVMLRYLDYNDVYFKTIGSGLQGGHPSELIPAVLALGEREHSSGREVITAIVLGYEISGRFTSGVIGLPMENRGWSNDTRGPYVMPLVAGKILDLNEEQMINALGISGSHNMVLGILDAPGEEYTMTKNLRFPRTAYGGVMAAMLARKGFTGPSRVIEGNRGFLQSVMGGNFDVDKLTQPSEHLIIMDTQFKSFCADRTMHGHLGATLTLLEQHNIRPEDVLQIRLWAGTRDVEHTGDEAKRYPRNKESADHSSYYCTGRLILDRALGPAQYTPEKIRDPKVRELSDKIIFQADPELDHLGAAGISEITTRDCKTYRCRVDYAKGDPRNPMTDGELESKFRAMASEYMKESKIVKVIDTVNRLEKLEEIGPLMKMLVF